MRQLLAPQSLVTVRGMRSSTATATHYSLNNFMLRQQEQQLASRNLFLTLCKIA